jgi:hypothetical protein
MKNSHITRYMPFLETIFVLFTVSVLKYYEIVSIYFVILVSVRYIAIALLNFIQIIRYDEVTSPTIHTILFQILAVAVVISEAYFNVGWVYLIGFALLVVTLYDIAEYISIFYTKFYLQK